MDKIINLNIFLTSIFPGQHIGAGVVLTALWQDIGFDCPGLEFWQGQRTFIQNLQIIYGNHPASYSVGTGFFCGVNRPGRESDRSPPSSAEVKKEWVDAFLHSTCMLSWRGK